MQLSVKLYIQSPVLWSINQSINQLKGFSLAHIFQVLIDVAGRIFESGNYQSGRWPPTLVEVNVLPSKHIQLYVE